MQHSAQQNVREPEYAYPNHYSVQELLALSEPALPEDYYVPEPPLLDISIPKIEDSYFAPEMSAWVEPAFIAVDDGDIPDPSFWPNSEFDMPF